MELIKAEPGSVSHATLNTQHLLFAFADALEDCVQRNARAWCSDEGRKVRDRLLAIVGEAREVDPASDEAAYLVNEVFFDELEAFAPDGHLFGAHEGDGSDFGFWPVED
jgi:hypothetical protein